MSLNLEKQLVFYGSYHHNKANVGIHVLCVPPILLTSLLLLTNTPAVPLPSWLSVPNLPLNVGTATAVLYSTLYILMEPVAGAMVAPILIGSTAYANHLTSEYGMAVNSWAGAINIACWIAQFIGHGKFEGRAPALLDNLVQAIFLAPFFVWFEILFKLGYRPELKRRIDQAVEQEIQKFKKSKDKAQNGSAK
jgi:uncharacterized membrane protein YGL010W